ncbi:helix-turn-helix domain-containing protein [Flexibacterium corallicola]|uniref:helix-turn-helix domain-containing protein n=1 Tax=Flexibacterium corallicola TaxID=3037259 RepID=UPI00286F74E2|nr:helix-turn-helix transcriptional regulator [Pseudovibrio sp. M1P-2-3]
MPRKNQTEEESYIGRYIGSRIRIRRTQIKLSQPQLGKLIGISHQQVQKYEHGIDRISSDRLFKISFHLNVEVSYFFMGISQLDGVEIYSKTKESELLAISGAFELLNNFKKCSSDVQKSILSLTKELSKVSQDS